MSLDWWSNSYVGARWIALEELPEHQYSSKPHHDPLAQLLVIASHQLVEMMLFQCINEFLIKNPDRFHKIKERFDKAHFYDAFHIWPKTLGFKPFDIDIEPFKSIDILNKQRNKTIHKESALATVEMARSALYTSVEGSKSIAKHFRGENGFPYEKVLEKYPIPKYKWFSNVKFIDRFSNEMKFPQIT